MELPVPGTCQAPREDPIEAAGASAALRAAGHQEEMDVVGHQAPRPDRRPRLGAAVAKEGEVAGVIGVRVEGPVLVGAPLRGEPLGARHLGNCNVAPEFALFQIALLLPCCTSGE
jgi:hypothetical protein